LADRFYIEPRLSEKEVEIRVRGKNLVATEIRATLKPEESRVKFFIQGIEDREYK
jgi:hypothetical protein